jgi:cell wall/surface repeat protein
VKEDTNLINWGFATGYAAYATIDIGNGVGVKYEFIEPIDTAKLKSMTLEFYHPKAGVEYYLHPLTAAPFSYATATQAIVTKGEAQTEDIALDLLAEDNGIVKGFILEQVRGADSTLYLDSVTPHTAAKIPAPFAQKVTASFDKKTPGDVSFNVKLSGAALTLKNGAEVLIADTDYTVGEDTIIVKQSYLMNMPKGQDTVLTAETVGGNLVLSISVADSRTYTVTFYNEDGKTPFGENATVMFGSLVAAPLTDPTKAATAEYTYKFDGWYNGETKWNFETDTVTGDLNLVAKFMAVKNKYTVTFDGKDGVQVEYGAKVQRPVTDPTKAATAEFTYKFDGWYNGDEKWDFENGTVTSDMTLVSRFTETLNRYTVTISFEGLEKEQVSLTLDYGANVDLTQYAEDGYTYVVKNGEAEVDEFTVTGETELTVVYTAVKPHEAGCGSSLSGAAWTVVAILSVVGAVAVIYKKRGEKREEDK